MMAHALLSGVLLCLLPTIHGAALDDFVDKPNGYWSVDTYGEGPVTLSLEGDALGRYHYLV